MAGHAEQVSQAPNFKDLAGDTCNEVFDLSKDSENHDFKKSIIELSIIS